MTLFDKNGKGLAHVFGQNSWIFKKAYFHIFSSLGPLSIQNMLLQIIHEMLKNDTFWQKWQGVSPSFLAKIHEFSKRLIFISFHLLDPCLFKICHCRLFHEMLKNDTFWQKWQGVSPCFWPKFMNFQKGLFSYLFISWTPVYSKYVIADHFMKC